MKGQQEEKKEMTRGRKGSKDGVMAEEDKRETIAKIKA